MVPFPGRSALPPERDKGKGRLDSQEEGNQTTSNDASRRLYGGKRRRFPPLA